MTNEEAIKWLIRPIVSSTEIGEIKAKELKAYELAIEALKMSEIPTGSDLISRREAINAIKSRIEKSEVGESVDHDKVIADIESLPSAEPRNKDAISREGLLKSWEELSPRGRTEFDQVIMTSPALPSAPDSKLKPTDALIIAVALRYLANDTDRHESVRARASELRNRILRDGAPAEPKTDDENELKFYYVESLDDYWVGRRLDNFYYANWHEGLGFVWSHSKYLPWGEHIVDKNTLWKKHTYPSKPIEIPFTEWIVGFVKKYSAEPKTGEWKKISPARIYECSECGRMVMTGDIGTFKFCHGCGAMMRGKEE